MKTMKLRIDFPESFLPRIYKLWGRDLKHPAFWVANNIQRGRLVHREFT